MPLITANATSTVKMKQANILSPHSKEETKLSKIFLFAQWEKIAMRCTQAISETHFPLARLESQRTHIT